MERLHPEGLEFPKMLVAVIGVIWRLGQYHKWRRIQFERREE
jgi:hypothetical protein